jgi:hypothetical protein
MSHLSRDGLTINFPVAHAMHIKFEDLGNLVSFKL